MNFARGKLMLASFLTLVASGVGFATRTAAGGDWEREFNIGGAEFGAILGAGFLGFGLMIFFGGILVEKFGYKKLLTAIACVFHLLSAGMLFLANPLFDSWRETNPEDATATGFQRVVLECIYFFYLPRDFMKRSLIRSLLSCIQTTKHTTSISFMPDGQQA